MPARFRFRLEPLLKLREALEREALRHLARTISALRAIEARLAELEAQQLRAFEGRRVQSGEVVDIDLWRAIERFLVVVERHILATRQDLRDADAQVQEARQALAKAHRAHLMLLRLKERRQEQHALEIQRMEYVEADEIAVLRHRFKPAQASIVSGP